MKWYIVAFGVGVYMYICMYVCTYVLCMYVRSIMYVCMYVLRILTYLLHGAESFLRS